MFFSLSFNVHSSLFNFVRYLTEWIRMSLFFSFSSILFFSSSSHFGLFLSLLFPFSLLLLLYVPLILSGIFLLDGFLHQTSFTLYLTISDDDLACWFYGLYDTGKKLCILYTPDCFCSELHGTQTLHAIKLSYFSLFVFCTCILSTKSVHVAAPRLLVNTRPSL